MVVCSYYYAASRWPAYAEGMEKLTVSVGRGFREEWDERNGKRLFDEHNERVRRLAKGRLLVYG